MTVTPIELTREGHNMDRYMTLDAPTRRAAMTLVRARNGWFLDLQDIQQVRRMRNGLASVRVSGGMYETVSLTELDRMLSCGCCGENHWNDNGTVLS